MPADYQKNKVYSWEQKYVNPKDTNIVPFNTIQVIVNWIWEQEDLKYPPSVLERKQTKNILADANRHELRFPPEGVNTWVILHELAHALTSDIDGRTHSHNEYFVGMYMKLLDKYMHIPMSYLMYTANMSDVKFSLHGKPLCKDD